VFHCKYCKEIKKKSKQATKGRKIIVKEALWGERKPPYSLKLKNLD
jgi:hypothetical protein